MDLKEKKENIVQIAFYGTHKFRAELQREALNRGVKVQHLIESALKEFLNAASPVKLPSASTVLPPTEYSSVGTSSHTISSSSDRKGRPFELLATIMSRSPRLIQEAIISNLEAFALVTEVLDSGKASEDAAARDDGATVEEITRAYQALRRASDRVKAASAGEEKTAARSAGRKKAR